MKIPSIGQRFRAASASYEAEAQAQRQIAGRLWALAEPRVAQGAAILEIGAGTGLLTRRILTAQPKKLTVNDLYTSPQMRALMEQQPEVLTLCEGDAETQDFRGVYDAIFSASTVQWFSSIENFFTRCAQHLPKGGLLAFSSFLPGNLHEVAELTGVGLIYCTVEALQLHLARQFDLLCLEQEEITLHFATPHDVLLHLRRTGVTGMKPVGWNKRKYLAFIDSYVSRYGEAQGVRLTYRPVYVLAARAD